MIHIICVFSAQFLVRRGADAGSTNDQFDSTFLAIDLHQAVSLTNSEHTSCHISDQVKSLSYQDSALFLTTDMLTLQ